jgi:hypothetical protein
LGWVGLMHTFATSLSFRQKKSKSFNIIYSATNMMRIQADKDSMQLLEKSIFKQEYRVLGTELENDRY